MKKQILILSAIVLILTGCSETHSNYPLVVTEVTTDFVSCSGSASAKYRVKLNATHGDDMYVYTDKLFIVGDTIK